MVRCILSVVTLGALLLASYWSARLAYADLLYRANTLESLTRAVNVDPGNARYHAWLAEYQENSDQNPVADLNKATALNPSDSSLWIRRGLRAEIEQDYANAERYLLEAARADKQFDPRWTLMNYYFRRGDLPQFWVWTQKALEMGYGDLTPIFHLCWKVTQDAEMILRVLPARAPVLAGFVTFLLAENRVEAAAQVAVQLVGAAGPEDIPLLLSCCERLLAQGQSAPALVLWNSMCSRKLVPGASLAPESGRVLTNPSFASAPLLQGFDWHFPTDPEITSVETGSGLKLSFSGRQPESFEIFWQYVPLSPGLRYRFRFQFQTSGAPPASGLRWRLSAYPAGKPLLLQSDWLSSEEWNRQEIAFSSQNASLGRLVLTYERQKGITRLEGSIVLRNLAIELAP